MDTCETLNSLLEQALADGNDALAAALEAAIAAAGCGAVTADSGGTGRPGGHD